MFEEKTIKDDGANGTIEEVLIAPVGKFTGSDAEGKPVPQNFTEESLTKIAEDLNNSGEEILLDKDHKSAKSGLDRDTQALGWFSKFIASAKGLFGLLKLTKSGRDMIEGREYRHVSPVFTLGEGNVPTSLVSVGATNTPAIAIPENVILNENPQTEEDKTDMTKEEIKALILETIEELKAKADEKKEETVEEVKEDIVKEETKPEETTENACAAKNEETEQKLEETEVEQKTEQKTVEKQPEVIKEEVLNSAPTASPALEPEWKNLHGAQFVEYVRRHPMGLN